VRPLAPDAAVSRTIPGSGIELLEEIGRGGMGTVWKAHDRRANRYVAVKFLSSDAGGETARIRFEREARSLAKLRHPGIVEVFELGGEGESLYIVMELAPGRPLSDRIPLPVDRALSVALQIAEAVAHAHAQGIVHRDLKPANILVDDRGGVKVADFGIARAFTPDEESDPRLTRTGEILGTPRYIAPEVFDGAPPDPRIDVYALGILLREMVETPRKGAEAVLLPGTLRPIVARATAQNPVERYAEAGELALDLWRASRRR